MDIRFRPNNHVGDWARFRPRKSQPDICQTNIVFLNQKRVRIAHQITIIAGEKAPRTSVSAELIIVIFEKILICIKVTVLKLLHL
jgi:hypothetical protein